MLSCKIKLFAAVMMVVFSLGANVALADHNDPFVQVICNPDLDYFSLRSFHIWDTDVWGESIRVNEIRKRIPKNGIYYLDDFVKSNYQCKLPTRNISLKVVMHRGGNHCYQDNAHVNIIINNKTVHNFDLFGGGCAEDTHQIEIDQFSLADCSRQEYYASLNSYASRSPTESRETTETTCNHVKTPSK